MTDTERKRLAGGSIKRSLPAELVEGLGIATCLCRSLALCNTSATAPREEQKLAQNTKALNGTKFRKSGKPEFSSTAKKFTSALSLTK